MNVVKTTDDVLIYNEEIQNASTGKRIERVPSNICKVWIRPALGIIDVWKVHKTGGSYLT
jgi:hypothetical protein